MMPSTSTMAFEELPTGRPQLAQRSSESVVAAILASIDQVRPACSGQQSQTAPLVERAQLKVCLPFKLRSTAAAVIMFSYEEEIGRDSLLNPGNTIADVGTRAQICLSRSARSR